MNRRRLAAALAWTLAAAVPARGAREIEQPRGSSPASRASGALEAASRAGATLRVALAAADLVIVGSDRQTVRVSPDPAEAAADAAAALATIALTTADDGDLRLAHVDGQAPERRLRLRVDAPATLAVDVAITNGAVRVETMRGHTVVRVVRGSIESRALAGRARLEVETGEIVADAVRLANGHSLKCRTFNGDVRIRLTARPDAARILALTLNGAIRSSLPLTTRAAFGPRFGETTLGAGTHVLSIDVVRGDIGIDVGR